MFKKETLRSRTVWSALALAAFNVLANLSPEARGFLEAVGEENIVTLVNTLGTIAIVYFRMNKQDL